MRSIFLSRTGGFVMAAAALGLAPGLAHAQMTFTKLGTLTYPAAISSDGGIVVGRNYPVYDLVRWTKESGAVVHRTNTYATGVSADGQTILANNVVPTGGVSGVVKGNVADGFSEIATNPGGYVFGAGLSGDGQIAVGNLGFEATRWVGTNAQFLGILPGGSRSFASAISEDGTTIVGYSHTTANTDALHAFRWTEATGMIDMGLLGRVNSIASEVSADGTYIVGYGVRSPSQGGISAFIWNEAGGATTIGTGIPTGVSQDGSLVVGGSYYSPTVSLEQGFLWTPNSGHRLFSSVLLDDYGFGSALAEWQNMVPTGMSSDGRYVFGFGLVAGLTEGWLLDRGLNPPDVGPGPRPIPEPGAFGLVAASLLFGVMVVKLRRRERA